MIASLLQPLGSVCSTEQISSWIKKRNREVQVEVRRIPFSEMNQWEEASDKSLHHVSGKFFSIEGIHVQTDCPFVLPEWEQPIIVQPEIGYLGILAKEIGGVLHFLMQAKIEPGNVNNVQISPTLQATKSNYSQVHGGRKATYLDYFRNASPNQILSDQLQSEQGSRFLKKRNRNIIIKVDEDIPVYEDFRWMTLGQIKEMMRLDNCVNMDTRTVVAGIDIASWTVSTEDKQRMSPFGLAMFESASLRDGYRSMREVLSWLTSLKSSYDLSVRNIPLKDVSGWTCREDEISREDGKYFRVIGVNVSIQNREVMSWCQPLVQPMQEGLCAFVVKKINGILHFLVQAKLECGNMDVFELAPTVQCLTGNIFNGGLRPPFTDYVLNAPKERVIFDVWQSEEGGRFYHEQNRNMMVMAEDDFPIDLPPAYQWMTLGQINEFMRYSNYINIQARSLIAAIRFV